MQINAILMHPAFRRVALGAAGGLLPTLLAIVQRVQQVELTWQDFVAVCLGGFVAFLYDKETDLMRLALVGACAPALLSGAITNRDLANVRDDQVRNALVRPAQPGGAPNRGDRTDIDPTFIHRPKVQRAQFLPAQLPPVSNQDHFCYGPIGGGGAFFAKVFGGKPVRSWIISRQTFESRERAQRAIAEIHKLDAIKNVSLPAPSILKNKDRYIIVYANGPPASNMSDALRDFIVDNAARFAPEASGEPLVVFGEDHMRKLVAEDKVAPCLRG